MKKKLMFSLFLSCLLFSCSNDEPKKELISNDKMQELIKSIKENDFESVKLAFAPAIRDEINDMDQRIREIFDLIGNPSELEVDFSSDIVNSYSKKIIINSNHSYFTEMYFKWMVCADYLETECRYFHFETLWRCDCEYEYNEGLISLMVKEFEYKQNEIFKFDF